MRKFQLLVLALGAVCAFSAMMTASAFALTWALANWLENGAIISVTKAVDTEGELLFWNLENNAEILCSGIFDGNVGPNGADDVTQVLTLGGVLVPELDENPGSGGIVCTSEKLCEANPTIFPVNLPYLTQLMLDTEDGLFYDLVQLNANGIGPAYTIICKVIGINVLSLCEISNDETFGQVVNTATDVESIGALTPESNCNGALENSQIENNASNIALILLTNGATLAASE
jgi:hypothetical protein